MKNHTKQTYSIYYIPLLRVRKITRLNVKKLREKKYVDMIFESQKQAWKITVARINFVLEKKNSFV